MNDQHRPQHPAYGPTGHPAGWHHPHTPAPQNGAGTTALVLGIVGAALSLIPLVGVIAWPVVIVGAVFGVVGLVRVRRGTATNRGAALAGLLCSIAGLVVCIAYAAAFNQAVDDAQPDPWLGQADPSFSAAAPADASTTPPAPLYPSVEPVAPSPDSIPGTGTFLVGADVEPGTYRSAPADGSLMAWCYWSRLSSLDGTLDSIIANDGGDGQKIVTIAASDAAFETSGCGTWERVE